MNSLKRWTPFVCISLAYVLLLRVCIISIKQICGIYMLKEFESISLSPIETAGDIIYTILCKIMYVSPQSVVIGEGFVDTLIETIISCTYGISLGIFATYTWFLSTKVDMDIKQVRWWSGKIPRWIMFITTLAAVFLQFIVWSQLPILNKYLPIIKGAIESYNHSEMKEYLITEIRNITLLSRVLLSIPVFCVVGLVFFINKKWKDHSEELNTIFYEWTYKSAKMSHLFKYQEKVKYPDIEIGLDAKTGEPVIQSGKDRNLNNLICGSIGTGKTSARGIPELNQDLNYLVDFINNFLDSTEEEKQNGVNGMIVIEPSNDLCKKIYQLTKSHNIPEEAVYYLDPTNLETIGINPLRGPVEKAVETFTQVISGLAANSEEFFKQAQRSHLKHYVYLLKLTKKNEATFEDLMEMYHDIYVVINYLEDVEKTIPHDYTEIENRDLRNHWIIVKGICSWFRERGIHVVTDRHGNPLYHETGKHRGKQMILDKQAEYVQGLHNILDDLSASKLLRRVLFGNSDFDIDTHLKAGGILLVNTAKGELLDLSNAFGKFILLLSANGLFRRNPEGKDPFHHIFIDEFPDYIYESFPSIPAQSRKYKGIITIASQSLAQLAQIYGDDYMYVLMNTLRSKMVYADVDPKTARAFSEYFGEDEVYEQTFQEATSAASMSSPGRRDAVTVKKTLKARLSVSEIIHLPEFYGAVKLAKKKVQIVKANFVPKQEFIKAKKRVHDKNAQEWLAYRKEIMANMEQQLLKEMGILQEGKSNPHDAVPLKEIERMFTVDVKHPIRVTELDKPIIDNVPLSHAIVSGEEKDNKQKSIQNTVKSSTGQDNCDDIEINLDDFFSNEEKSIVEDTKETEPINIYDDYFLSELLDQNLATQSGNPRSDSMFDVIEAPTQTLENRDPLSTEELFQHLTGEN